MALSFDDLLSSTSSQPAPVTPPADISQENLSKFLDFTSKSEGADYNTIVGGKTFKDYTKHPGVVGLTTPEGPSTAAGRYQITKTTYDDVATKLGIKDFSPESQDKIALELIRRKDALEDVKAGRFEQAIGKLGKTWASFSSSTYNQPKNTAEKEAKLLAESKGSLSFDDLLPATTTTSTAKDSKGSLSFDDLLPKEEKQNWLGTGPEMTTGEYFKSGFKGRFLSNAQHLDELDKQAQDKVLATYGKSIKDNTKKYQSLVKKELDTLVQKEQLQAKEEAKLNPEPTMGEAFKQFGEELVTSPWKTAKSFLYELGKDPDLVFLGGGVGAVKAVVGAGKLAKTAQAAKAIGTAAIKPAATGAALETLAETGSPAEYNPQAIANTAAMFGAFGATMKAGGMALKAVKTPAGGKPRAPYTPEEFEAELNRAEQEVRNMGDKNNVQTFKDFVPTEETKAYEIPKEVGDAQIIDLAKEAPEDFASRHNMDIEQVAEQRKDFYDVFGAVRSFKDKDNKFTIEVDSDKLAADFESGFWQQAFNLPKGVFKNSQEYLDFLIHREVAGKNMPEEAWKAANPDKDPSVVYKARQEYYDTLGELKYQVGTKLLVGEDSSALAAQIKKLEAQGAPKPVIQNRLSLTPEELKSVIYGSKNAGEAVDRLLSSRVGNSAQRELFKAIQESKYISKTNLHLEDTVRDYNKDLLGEYDPIFHSLSLFPNADLNTFAHEMLHAGTYNALRSPEGAKFTAKFETLLDALKSGAEKDELWNDTTQEGFYGLKDIDELISETFSNSQFRTWLRKRSVLIDSVPQTGWEAFKNVLKSIFKLKQEGISALDQIIDLTYEATHQQNKYGDWTRKAGGSKDFDVTTASYITDLNKIALKESAKSRLKASEEATKMLEDNPSLAEAGDIFKGDTTTEQTPVNVIHRVIADTILNNRAARIFRESIERMVPNKKIRERMTMAIEGAKETDRLLTDAEKKEILYGTGKVKAGTQFVDRGLTGALEGMSRKYASGAFKNEAERAAYKERLDKLEYTVNMLKELPSEENAIKVLKVIQDKLRVIGEQAKTEGLFEQLRQNYVTHVLDFSDSALSKAQQTSLRDRILGGKESRFVRDFAQHRIYKTIRDLEKRLYEAGQEMGLDTRGVKVQRDIARIAEVYQQSMMNAVIQKKAINFLAKQKAPLRNGKQLELLTKDHKVAFENGYVKFTGHGSEALKDFMVHPDLVDALGHLFNEKDPGTVLKILSGVSMLSKTITTMASLFHATSLAWARAGATPYGMLKEIGTGFKGTRAALETIRHDGLSKEVDAWTRSGLKFETEDIQQGILPEVAKNVDNFITKLATSEDIRLTRRVIDPLDAHVLQTLNTFTWDFMHAAGKFATAQYIFAKIKTRNPDMPDYVIRNEVSAFVNNTFGGLDWLKIASEVGNKVLYKLSMKAYGKEGRTWLQIAMFAPDWTISTLRSYTKALPKDLLRPQNWEIKAGAKGLFNPRTSGDLARRYVATTAMMWLTFLNGINVATSGHYIWENDDPTRIDLGDGTTMQAAKHSMEGPHWLMHPIKTGFNKMGYVPKTIAALGSPYVNTPLDVAKTIAEPFVPFQVSAAIQAPKGEGLKNAALSFVGLPRYGQTNKANTSPEVLQERKTTKKATARANKEKKLKRM